MVNFYPARPTWRAASFSQALFQLGFTEEEAEAVLTASAVDQNERCIFLTRDDMPHICDVVVDNAQNCMPDGKDAVLVLECRMDLVSESYDEAVAKWPHTGRLWVVGGRAMGRPQ